MDNKPFTENEQKVWDLLAQAHAEFVNLNRVHPMEVSEWVTSMHALQNILAFRVVARDYPGEFKTVQ